MIFFQIRIKRKVNCKMLSWNSNKIFSSWLVIRKNNNLASSNLCKPSWEKRFIWFYLIKSEKKSSFVIQHKKFRLELARGNLEWNGLQSFKRRAIDVKHLEVVSTSHFVLLSPSRTDFISLKWVCSEENHFLSPRTFFLLSNSTLCL